MTAAPPRPPRPWGTGSVTPHGERFRARLPLSHGRGSLGIFTDEQEAHDVLDAALVELVDAPLDALTLATWGDRWLPTRDVRPGTLSRDLARWRATVTKKPLGRLALAEVTELHVETWLASMRELAVQTRRNALGLVRQALAAATHLGGPIAGRRNAAAAVKMGKRGKAKKGVASWTWLRLHEIEAVLAVDTVPLRSRLFWTVAIYSGLRAGELCGLRWDCVDFDRGVLHVRWSRGEDPKSGLQREVPMLAPVREALTTWRTLYDAAGVRSHLGLVWPARDGGYHADGYDAGWYEAVREMAGRPLARASLHDLRHTCASHLIQGSWAPALLGRALRIEEVSLWLGHADIKTTQRYAHLSPEGIAGLVTPLVTTLKPPPRFELGTYGLRTSGGGLGSAEDVAENAAVSSEVTRLRALGVRSLEAIERGDPHRDHRAIEAAVALIEDCDRRLDVVEGAEAEGRRA